MQLLCNPRKEPPVTHPRKLRNNNELPSRTHAQYFANHVKMQFLHPIGQIHNSLQIKQNDMPRTRSSTPMQSHPFPGPKVALIVGPQTGFSRIPTGPDYSIPYFKPTGARKPSTRRLPTLDQNSLNQTGAPLTKPQSNNSTNPLPGTGDVRENPMK
jgi:hypothetical protein